MRFFRARSLILSPSKRSIARHALPPRPALKSLSGSGSLAPWAKVTFTLSLWALPTAIIPSRNHTGLPIHFHSSIISWSTSRILLRMLAGWHISFDVLDRFLVGKPIGAITGVDAMKFAGWQRFVAEYSKQFGRAIHK